VSRVVAKGVSKMWTPTAGLRPVDLDVAGGELVVVRGRSGSGKSTLLALLAGLTTPDSGSLDIDGRSPVADEPWSRVALVPQVLALAIELSVRENVTDALTVPDGAAVDALLAALGLTDEAERAITEISMGQQQRTALARAIAAEPALLLADEPTSFQDGGHAAAAIDTLRLAARRGAAVVIATHDVAVVAAADRVLDLSPD
jgi:putative ABC transport system ATP-binding protein